MTDPEAMGSSPPIARARVETHPGKNRVSYIDGFLHRGSPFLLFSLLLVIVLFGGIRYRLRSMPLERDEGEYAYSGQLMLQGIPPYRLAYNLKLPGIYAAYALLLAAFGQTPDGIHIGLLFVSAISSLLLYLLASTLFGELAGLVAAASYSLLAANPSVVGFEAHATNFVVLPALCAILILLRGLRSHARWLFFASGVCSGVAFLMKQHGVFFAFFCFFFLILERRKTRTPTRQLSLEVISMGAGFLLPYAVTCALLYHFGVFNQFWFWTVTYAGEYSKMGLRRGAHAFVENYGAIFRANILIWLIALIGLSAAIWNQNARKHFGFTSALLFFSFLSLCPGAYFRPHYFILLLPISALLVGIAIAAATDAIAKTSKRTLLSVPARYAPAIAFAAVFGLAIVRQHSLYFSSDPASVMQATYGESPFFSAMKIGDYLRQHSVAGARIAVLGSEPEIYFYAQRHSATGYLYMYSLIVRQRYTDHMQKELMRELSSNHPDYLVYVDVPDSWGEDRENAPQAYSFLTWMRQFSSETYEVAAISRLEDPTVTTSVQPKTPSTPNTPAIYLLKRNTEETGDKK